jgi:hypothetical protein
LDFEHESKKAAIKRDREVKGMFSVFGLKEHSVQLPQQFLAHQIITP